MKELFLLFFLGASLSACTTPKPYENTVRPDGEWRPVNPEHFGKAEAQRIIEGQLKL